jgi:hypothetical protein
MALTPSFASLFIGFKKKAPEPRAPDKKKKRYRVPLAGIKPDFKKIILLTCLLQIRQGPGQLFSSL